MTLAGLSLFLLLTTLGGAAQAQPATPIPGESVYTLAGSGTTNPSKLFWCVGHPEKPDPLLERSEAACGGAVSSARNGNGFRVMPASWDELPALRSEFHVTICKW